MWINGIFLNGMKTAAKPLKLYKMFEQIADDNQLANSQYDELNRAERTKLSISYTISISVLHSLKQNGVNCNVF